jgi:hypothetical protein
MEVSGQLHASAALPPPSGETVPGIHCIGGWLDPRAGLDLMEKKEVSFPCRKWNRDSSVAHSIAYLGSVSLMNPNYTKYGVGMLGIS